MHLCWCTESQGVGRDGRGSAGQPLGGHMHTRISLRSALTHAHRGLVRTNTRIYMSVLIHASLYPYEYAHLSVRTHTYIFLSVLIQTSLREPRCWRGRPRQCGTASWRSSPPICSQRSIPPHLVPLLHSFITQLQVKGPSRTCNES